MLNDLLWAYVNTNWLENREPTPEDIEEIEEEIKQRTRGE